MFRQRYALWLTAPARTAVGLRTCDFYALGAVGIQDIFVRGIGDQTCQSGSSTDEVRQERPHFSK
jgi:hypothetical protein